MLAFGRFELGLGVEALQTWTFATLVFGNQALLYVLRERRRMWRLKPSGWVFASSVADIAIVVVLAGSGILMAPLPWRLVVAACAAGVSAILFAVPPPRNEVLAAVRSAVQTAHGRWIPQRVARIAIVLMPELDSPYRGSIRLSSAPLLNALAHIGQ